MPSPISAPAIPAPGWPGPAMYDALRRRAPLWAFGVQGQACRRSLLESLTTAVADDLRFLPILQSALHWQWQERPLDAELAGSLLTALSARGTGGFLPAEGFSLLQVLSRRAALLAPLRQAWDAAMDDGREDALARLGETLSAHPLLAALPLLRQRLLAELALHQGDDAAPDLLAALPPVFGGWRAVALGKLLAGEDPPRAVALLHAAWRAMPWHVNLALRLHDLALRPRRPGCTARTLAMSRETVICLYTWNKARPLAQALEALARADLAEARVLVLDNGSDDATPRVVEEFLRRCPAQADALRLPVNIGAPAARNWLLAQPAVRRAAFVLFLDDDAIVPPHFLLSLLETAADHPGAGSVGCRVAGPRPPHPLQGADFHLLPAAWCPSGFGDLPERLHLLDNGLGEPDLGLHDYDRPCPHVTGCCHLLRRGGLEAAGGFDTAFSPSQFDDAERDLRAGLAGWPALYAGRVAVRHLQHSSLNQAREPFQQARIHANKAAMELRFTDEQAARLARDDAAATLADLAARLNALEEL